jgi:hypothetical protein
MSKLLVVEGDPVDGTDTHNVTGSTTSSPPTPYTGTGDYAYKGEVSTGLSDFVTVGGIALAMVTSGSDLRSEGKTDHLALNGASFNPSGADSSTLAFVPSTGVGPGTPNQAAGSSLLTVNGDKALLDGDAFDTCGVPGGEASSKVTAKNQDFVTCSA